MITNYSTCLNMLLEHEGGFVNHPSDPGGITNLGVTKAVYESYIGRKVVDGEMEGLTHDDVYPIYKENYWDAIRGDYLPSGVDWSTFDWAVNSGKSRASKALQRIVGVEADGGIGPMTLQAVAEISPKEIIKQMHYVRNNFYKNLDTFHVFGKGWIRRNEETLKTALEMIKE